MPVLALLAVLATTPSREAGAIAEDACEKRRAAFPKKWQDTSAERLLLECWGHYVRLSIRVRRTKAKGASQDTFQLSAAIDDKVFRATTSPAEIKALSEGRHVDLFLQSEDSCFIRGNIDDVVYIGFADRTPERVTDGNLGRVLVAGSLDLINACESPSTRTEK